MSAIHVAVTGLHAADNPAPGIGVIRSIRAADDWDGRIIGLAYDVYDTGIHDRELLDAVYMIPYPNQGMEEVFQRIKYIHEQERIDVLLPTLDSELTLYNKLQPRLLELGIRMFLPDEIMVRARSKAKLVEFCEENDIPTPKTIIVNDPENLKEACEKVKFPCYIKGIFYEAYKCGNIDDARKHMSKISQMWGLPVLVQEDLPGEEFDVCVLARDGEMMGAVPMRKVRLTDKGKAWAAVSLKNDALRELSEKIISAIGWNGPCELEVMKDNKTKQLYLIEINPRFPAWIYLGAGAEQNLPRMAVDLALGKDVQPLPPAKSGVTFVRHATDMICSIDILEQLIVSGEVKYEVEG